MTDRAHAPSAATTKRSTVRSFFRSLTASFEHAIRGLLTVVGALWLTDTIVVLAMHGLSGRTLHGLAVALGVAYLLTLLLAIVGAGASSLLPAARGPTTMARIEAWLRRGDPETRRDRATEAAAWMGLALAFASAVAAVTPEVLDRVVTDAFRAVTLAMLAIVLAIATLLVRRQSLRLAELLLAPFRRIPFVRALFATPPRLVATLLTPVLLGAAVFFAMRWEVYRSLPWLLAGRLAGAIAVGFAITALVRVVAARSRRMRLTVTATISVVLVACMIVAFVLPREAYTPRRIASEDALSGAAAYGALRFAFDFDRDGYLTILGDGDCKEFAPTILPGSIDIPGNGIDENCDGEDASFTPLAAEVWSTPLPDGAPDEPDIVLVTVDGASPHHLDVGTDAGGTTADERADTPNIRAWADDGFVFDHAFVQGPSTRLSFPSIFTSRWDSELPRVRSRRLPHGFECEGCRLATLARSAGYDTTAVVSNVYFSRARWPSILEGFRVVDETSIAAGSHNAERVSEQAIQQLERDRSRPLFLWVHYYDAHSPFTRVAGDPMEASTPRELHHRELAFVDTHVQTLFEAIDSEAPEALVILASDHGTVFRGPAARRRGHYGYDLDTAALHIPLVIRAPWLPSGHSEALVSSMDIMPTVLNTLGVDGGEDLVIRGRSLFRHVADTERPTEGRMLFHQLFLPEKELRGRDALQQVSVRTDQYNLIFNRKAARWEMYDWREDYFEQENLLDAEPPPREAALHRALEGFVFAVYEVPKDE